jgi:hypothetical protein
MLCRYCYIHVREPWRKFWLRRLINILEVNFQLEAGFFGFNEKKACESRSLSVLIINFPVSQVSIYRVVLPLSLPSCFLS